MKTLRYFVMMLIALCTTISSFGTVEAKGVALLPLINNVADRDDLGAIYYDRAVEATKLDVDFDIVDNSELDAAISKNIKPNTLPDKVACEAIAQATNVDHIFIMQVDELGYKERNSKESDTVELNMKGRCVSYNAITGKYVAKSIMEQDAKDGSLLVRYDIVGQQFGDSVTREIKKALGIKKFGLQKQTIRMKS